MTSSLHPTAPLRDPEGRSFRQYNIWRESQAACTQQRMKQNPTSCLDDSLRLFLPTSIFPSENCHGWAESLELVSWHKSNFSPGCQIFWLPHLSFLLTLASQITGLWVAAAKPGFGNNLRFCFVFFVCLFCLFVCFSSPKVTLPLLLQSVKSGDKKAFLMFVS